MNADSTKSKNAPPTKRPARTKVMDELDTGDSEFAPNTGDPSRKLLVYFPTPTYLQNRHASIFTGAFVAKIVFGHIVRVYPLNSLLVIRTRHEHLFDRALICCIVAMGRIGVLKHPEPVRGVSNAVVFYVYLT